jgi:RNA polymerase sigma factor (sigma-70 family)
MLSDERLAQLAAGGSDPAFAALYSRYSGTLFAYCRSITRNADDGWDALQNAMLKVLVALRRAPERSAPVRPWLFCICHNESIGVLRRRSAAERVADPATWAVAAGADEQALMREHVTETVSDVQQLPTGQRAALVMRELADLRYDEIAVALETTEGNARQLVFAARAGLRDSRAGRGLPCESVRDQLSLADGRLLRRRSVRAHLRTCDGCREYAVSMRRRAAQPNARVAAWSPLAGYQLLEPVFRAAAASSPAVAQGASSLIGPLAVKAATVGALVATGLGAADVATTPRDPSPARSASASGSASGSASASGQPSDTTHVAAVVATSPAAAAKTQPAVFRVAARPRPAARRTEPRVAKRHSAAVPRTSAPRAREDEADAELPARPGATRHEEPRREQRAPAPAEPPARAQADCDTSDSGAHPQQQPVQQQPVHEEPPPTRQAASNGDPQRQPAQGQRGFAAAR